MSSNVRHIGNYLYLLSNGKTFKFDVTKDMIGKGAMGVVYKGMQCDNRQPVAIKCLAMKNNPRAQEIRLRARLEADLAFSHQNMIEMIGICETENANNPVFLISKYVQGINFDKYVKDLEPREEMDKHICKLFLPVLDALEFIHNKGIAHLDVKPTNIMIENGCNIRLMDLGIANYLDTSSSLVVSMMGTPQYAAPEQFSSLSSNSFGASTDIYQAGVTLYELITGNNPFNLPTVKAMKKAHESLILTKNKKISKKIYKVLCKATAIDPEMRYQTAVEMKTDLQSAIKHHPNGLLSGLLSWMDKHD